MYVTYQDLIQIGILVVALVNLIYQIFKDKKKQPPLPTIATADPFRRVKLSVKGQSRFYGFPFFIIQHTWKQGAISFYYLQNDRDGQGIQYWASLVGITSAVCDLCTLPTEEDLIREARRNAITNKVSTPEAMIEFESL